VTIPVGTNAACAALFHDLAVRVRDISATATESGPMKQLLPILGRSFASAERITVPREGLNRNFCPDSLVFLYSIIK
jgi:hypothetical protein